jgi:trimethyllysine dioxygenase
MFRYAALKHWNSILSSQESEYWVKLTPGTVVGEWSDIIFIGLPNLARLLRFAVFDNHRVLHGRATFTGIRHLCGAYIGADDYIARLRALRHRQLEAAHADPDGGGYHIDWAM